MLVFEQLQHASSLDAGYKFHDRSCMTTIADLLPGDMFRYNDLLHARGSDVYFVVACAILTRRSQSAEQLLLVSTLTLGSNAFEEEYEAQSTKVSIVSTRNAP